MKKTEGKVVHGLVLALALGAGAGAVSAGVDHDEARRLREQGVILPLPAILQKATAAHPGRVLEVELEHKKRDGYIYEVEIMDSRGTVWELRLDAADGRVLDRDDED